MSSSPWVDFNNILCAAFTLADPNSPKKDCQVKQLFALLGYQGVKAVHKQVDEIDTNGQFQQTLVQSTNARVNRD